MKTNKQLRIEIKSIYNSIKRDQRCVLNSIRLEIKEVPDTKIDLENLKARINEEFRTQNWFLK